jgi:hypothetical protein
MSNLLGILDHPYNKPQVMPLDDGEVYIVMCEDENQEYAVCTSAANDTLHQDWDMTEVATKVVRVYKLKARKVDIEEEEV